MPWRRHDPQGSWAGIDLRLTGLDLPGQPGHLRRDAGGHRGAVSSAKDGGNLAAITVAGGSALELDIKRYAEALVLRPRAHGIDHNSAADFEAALMPHVHEVAAREGRLVLDLGEVQFMSSVGLRVIMMAYKYARAHGGVFSVAALSETLAEIFQISRFHLLFGVFDDVPAALAEASPEARAAASAGPG